MSAYTPRASLSVGGNRGSAAILQTDTAAQLCAAFFDRPGYPAARCSFRPAFTGQQGDLHTQMRATGYRAPYLRRVAYTFPYLHNGSVPTLYHVLFPEERPDRWRVDPDHYDHHRLGQQVDPRGREPATARERRMIFDTSLPGKGNDGHDTILEPLSRAERLSILEYLKTL
jgi:hypothetical protein